MTFFSVNKAYNNHNLHVFFYTNNCKPTFAHPINILIFNISNILNKFNFSDSDYLVLLIFMVLFSIILIYVLVIISFLEELICSFFYIILIKQLRPLIFKCSSNIYILNYEFLSKHLISSIP